MRYPEEVYKAGAKAGAPVADGELSREERRARRAGKKRASRKPRAQKVPFAKRPARGSHCLTACKPMCHRLQEGSCIVVCSGSFPANSSPTDHEPLLLPVHAAYGAAQKIFCLSTAVLRNQTPFIGRAQDSDKRARSVAAGGEAPLAGRKSAAASDAADAKVKGSKKGKGGARSEYTQSAKVFAKLQDAADAAAAGKVPTKKRLELKGTPAGLKL